MFREIVSDRHQYAQSWKERTGGKVVGYMCTYVPEEILYAAGMLPVRILGSHEPPVASEPHIWGMFCSHSRDCLAQGLEGRYSYLDGLVSAHPCLHMAQAFNSWVRHVPIQYSYELSMPAHVKNRHAQECCEGDLALFKSSLEDWTGKPISNQSLDRAIDVYSTNRRLLRQVYELRKSETPPVSGSEAMEMVLASQLMDKEEHNRLLGQLLEELPSREKRAKPRARLMTLGGENDDLEFFRLIESLGADVVVDDLCTGSRYFWNDIVPQDDRVAAIASYYINRPVCAFKDFERWSRLPHMLSLVKDYKVQAVIAGIQKFCDPYSYDIPPILSCLKENGIPNLLLEYHVTMPAGQFRTRIEALLETIELESIMDEW